MSWTKEKIDYNTYEKPSDFMNFGQGDTVIRIISDGYIVRKHQYKAKGQFISTDCKGKVCDLCKAGIPVKTRYTWIVLNRDTGKVKILEAGITLGHEVTTFGRHTDIRTFDIIITRKGTGTSTVYTAKKLVGSPEITEKERNIITEYLPILKEQYLGDGGSAGG